MSFFCSDRLGFRSAAINTGKRGRGSAEKVLGIVELAATAGIRAKSQVYRISTRAFWHYTLSHE